MFFRRRKKQEEVPVQDKYLRAHIEAALDTLDDEIKIIRQGRASASQVRAAAEQLATPPTDTQP